jgi:hypothetical protein
MMERNEIIFLSLAVVGLVAVVLFEIKRNTGLTIPPASVDANEAGAQVEARPEIGPAYLTTNTPNFNPGPPVYNVLPALGSQVAAQNAGGNTSCNSCG